MHDPSQIPQDVHRRGSTCRPSSTLTALSGQRLTHMPQDVHICALSSAFTDRSKSLEAPSSVLDTTDTWPPPNSLAVPSRQRTMAISYSSEQRTSPMVLSESSTETKGRLRGTVTTASAEKPPAAQDEAPLSTFMDGPGDDFGLGTHVVTLSERTIDANQRFFASRDDVPRHALSMGIKSIMSARRILIVVSGADKAEALCQAVSGPVTNQVPASVLQLHPDVTLVADEAALSKLRQAGAVL